MIRPGIEPVTSLTRGNESVPLHHWDNESTKRYDVHRAWISARKPSIRDYDWTSYQPAYWKKKYRLGLINSVNQGRFGWSLCSDGADVHADLNLNCSECQLVHFRMDDNNDTFLIYAIWSSPKINNFSLFYTRSLHIKRQTTIFLKGKKPKLFNANTHFTNVN